MRLNRVNSAIDRTERNKLNENFDIIERGQSSVQNQINQLVIEGDSSVEAAQARVSSDDTVYNTLKERLDTEKEYVTQQLEQVTKLIYPILTTQNQIQEALNAGGHFKFVGGLHQYDLLYDDTDTYKCAFILSDNTTIEFAQDTKLELKAHNFQQYKIFAVTNKRNIKFLNVTIDGRRDLNSATGGEWGFGIALKGSTDVFLENVRCDNVWGDGLYVGSTDEQNYCQNVNIKGFYANNNRRQGISIISAKGLYGHNLYLSNTNGAEPSDGIDFEPNNNLEFLQDIVLENVFTDSNVGSGIKFYMGFYTGSQNTVSVTIRNHVDKNSAHGFRAREYLDNMKGFIKLENCHWINTRVESSSVPWSPFYIQDWAASGLRIDAIDCTVEFGTAITNATNIFGYFISKPSTTADEKVLGNVHLIRPSLISRGTAPQRGIWVSPNTSASIKNVSIIDPIRLDVDDNLQLSIEKPLNNFVVTDSYKVLHRSLSAHYAHTNVRYKCSYDNAPATIQINLSLPESNKTGHEFTVTNLKSVGMYITPANGTLIYPLITEPNKRLKTTTIGATITLLGIDGGYLVKNIVGEWTTEDVPT